LQVADLGAADVYARNLIPARVARKLMVLPLRYTDRALTVATSDPVSLEAEREISYVSGRNVQFEVATPPTLALAVEETYPPHGEERREATPLPSDTAGGPRVLVVDDDADTRRLLRTVLEQKGFRVDEASDGSQALALLQEGGSFDLVTLDLQMDHMHGLDVLRQIRSKRATAAVPVIVATGAGDPAVEMQLFEAGADDFVVKPVDPPRFLLRVQAVLRRRGAGWLHAEKAR
jgi:CheY-like chemotaxis protein